MQIDEDRQNRMIK